MLPIAHRFKLRQDQNFFSHSRRLFSPSLTLWYQRSTTEAFQAAFVVPKKLLKRSTDRHWLLRQLRASVAIFLKEADPQPTAQVVLMPTRKGVALSRSEFQAEVLALLRKIPSS